MIVHENVPHYSLEEIKRYIESQDSLGDVAYFLNDKNIAIANASNVEEEDRIQGHPYPGHETWDD